MTRRGRLLLLTVCGAAMALSTSGCETTYLKVMCLLNHGTIDYYNGKFACYIRGAPQQPARAAGNRRVDPFTARIATKAVRRGRSRGRRVTGIVNKGTVRISARGAARRLLRGYTRARLASSGSMRVGGRDGLGRIQAYLWLTFPRGRGAACLRVDAQAISVDGPPAGQLQFRSAGGTGRAARLSVIGSVPVSGQSRVVRGTWQVKRAKARRAPSACRKLAHVR